MEKAPRVIRLTEHNPQWKERFLVEKQRLKNAFKGSERLDNLVDILHIGSTSVAGVVAKPILDIIIIVKHSDAIDPILYRAGYRYKGEYNLPMRKLYGKKKTYEVYLHVYEEGNDEISLNVIFRDYLNSHSEARGAYSTLKESILEKDNYHSKLASTGITTYNLEKNDFIQNILAKAGFMGLCMRLCTHTIEWEAYSKIRGDDWSKISAIQEINSHDAHQKHIVLYAGTKIVAAAQLQLSPPNAFLEFSGLTPEIQSKAREFFQSYLFNTIEKWVKKLNLLFLTTAVSGVEVSIDTAQGDQADEAKPSAYTGP